MASTMTPALLDELQCVILRKTFCVEGARLEKGRIGTIVHVYLNANAYEIEFAEPVGTLLTVKRTDIEPYAT